MSGIAARFRGFVPPNRPRLLAAGVFALGVIVAQAAPLLTPGDPVFAYDLDSGGSSTGGATYPATNYPSNENPPKAIDGLGSTKYLNQSKYNAGIIVTPSGSAAARSMLLTTANDSPERDPSSYIILGSNQPITSADKSNGFSDHWEFIAQGTLSLPSARLTTAGAINFNNVKTYSSYWIVFPTTRDNVSNSLMQIAEIQLYTGTGGTGSAIFTPGNPTLCTGWNSSIASGELVSRVIDGNASTKYLNFGENNSGFYVVPSVGPSIIDSFQLTTANDSDVRDPATWQLHGMAPSGVWNLIGSGSVTLPTARGTAGPVVPVANTNPYLAYRMTFTTVRNAGSANSMQVAEAQFFGTILPANDNDFDGMDDDWETLYGLTVGVNDSTGDLDSDGSPNLQEYQRTTLPNNPDTDADGLADGVETATGTFVSASDTGTGPKNPDTDGDTYGDNYEVLHGTNPTVAGSIPTITWDITPGAAGGGDSAITGGTGTWDDLSTANWTTDAGANNVVWDNAGLRVAAIFGGTGGIVTLATPIHADRLIVESAGYLFTGATLTLGASAPSVSVATGSCEMAQVIAGTGGFTKLGAGELKLTGDSNTYTGTTVLKGIGKLLLAKNAGQIAIPGDVFLDSFAFNGNNSGLVLAEHEQIADTAVISWANVGQADTYFRLNGHIETIGGLVSTGVGTFVNVENRGNGDTAAYADGMLIINTPGSSSHSYNGNIRNADGGTGGGTVGIIKTGSGTQIFSGNTSYSGPTMINGGTLQIDSNLSGSPVAANPGGTVSGTGTLGAGVIVAIGGTISPGIAGTGTLSAGNTTISGTYLCQIDGTGADRLTVTGNLNLSGAALQISELAAASADSYVLASYTGALSGTFSVVGAPSGYLMSYDSGAKQIKLVKNNAPTFSGFAASTPHATAATISLGKVLTAGADADNDTLTVTAAGPASANGGTAVLQAGSILYTPAAGFSGADTFTVTVTDSKGASVNGTVTVTVGSNSGTGTNSPVLTSLPGGDMKVDFQGIPGRSYQVQRSTDLENWTVLTTAVAGPTGAVTFTDEDPPSGSAFYRLRKP